MQGPINQEDLRVQRVWMVPVNVIYMPQVLVKLFE